MRIRDKVLEDKRKGNRRPEKRPLGAREIDIEDKIEIKTYRIKQIRTTFSFFRMIIPFDFNHSIIRCSFP